MATAARSNAAALAYVAVACIGLVLGRYAILLTAGIGETFLRDLRVRSFRHLMGLGLDFFEREQTGRLVSRLTADVDALQELVQSGLTSIVQNVLLFIGSTIAIFILSWQLALTLLVVVPPAIFATRWFRRESNRAYVEVRERIGHNLATLQEGLAGVRVVQAFGRESSYALRFRETNEAQYDANIETARVATRYFPFMEFLGVATMALVIGIGGLFTDQGLVSVGTVAAFVLYLTNLFDPVQNLSQQYNVVQSAGAALKKIFELLEVEPSIGERPDAVALPPTGAVALHDVSFAYGDGADVLRDVTLTIAPGERIALVGPTGAGKSTLAKLAVRFYDPRAERCRSVGSTCATRRCTLSRERIVVVPQEGFMFAGTVRDNIRVGRPDATDAEVEAAVDALGVRDRFESLPGGLDTEVRERGSRLSGGERQLVSLRARRARRSHRPRARRGDVEPRSRDGAHRRARARGPHRGPHRRGGRAPTVDRGARRSGRGRRRRCGGRARHPRRAPRARRAVRAAVRVVVGGRVGLSDAPAHPRSADAVPAFSCFWSMPSRMAGRASTVPACPQWRLTIDPAATAASVRCTTTSAPGSS